MKAHPDQVQYLLENESFRQWVFTPNDTLEQTWQTWLAQHPDQRETAGQARILLLDARGELPVFSDQHIEARVADVLAALQPVARPVRWLLPVHWQWVAAASVVLLAGMGWLLKPLLTTTAQPSTVATRPATDVANPSLRSRQTQTTNRGKTRQRIPLADGSTVYLQPGSSLTYPNEFGDKQRDVYLTGEAFFEVAHDPSHPFWVHAPGLNTKVLGTSFSVRSDGTTGQARVSVRTGRVSVYATTDAPTPANALRSVVLTPNQQVVLSFADNRLTRSLVEQPQLVASVSTLPSFAFRRTPLPTVLRTLEQAYGIPIIYDERSLLTCTLTATLGEESIWEKLRWICAGTGSTYEVIDGQIVLSSPGCSP